MIPELQKPRVTEIQVRMDCNGCVQKIKKALHGINGIYDHYIDFPQQKLTIIGWADPEKIIKAIKKTRKIAIICSHSEQPDPPAQPTETSPGQPTEQAPAPDMANPPPPEGAPPAEPPKDPPPPPPENPPPGAPPPTTANDPASQPPQPSRPKDAEEVHVIYHHPPVYDYRYGYGHGYGHSYGNNYGGQWNNYPNSPQYRHEPSPPVYATRSDNTYTPLPYVTHSYNTYKPSPYVTEYEYSNRSPPRYMHYSSRPERYSDDYNSSNNGNGNGNITSMFSDENPNACRIV
ncbi:unnamed protein product [Camellia sinensis]